MIKVDISMHNGLYQSFNVSGHAGSGEPGFDLVCAAVSSLMTGALNGFDELTEGCSLKLTQEPRIEIDLGVSTELKQKLSEFLHTQLKTVEYTNKEYISITVKEATT